MGKAYDTHDILSDIRSCFTNRPNNTFHPTCNGISLLTDDRLGVIMIIDVNAKTETNCTLENKAFSIKASPVAFEILCSKLYSDPTGAIIRELLTNAYDSHKEAGTLDKPIKVTLPTELSPNFIIRDQGTGLSKTNVTDLYTTFFDSTKSTTNDYTGCFGLGSKTPFSYTSSFTVKSYFNGTEYGFLAVKKDGYPYIFSTIEKPTDEPNGLEISIPVERKDFSEFRDKLAKYTTFIPELNLELGDETIQRTVKCIYRKDNLAFYENSGLARYKGIIIKQGQNVYSLPAKAVDKLEKYFFNMYGCGQGITLVIEVPIGTLAITPSRELLSVDEANIEKLQTILEESMSKVLDIVDNNEIITKDAEYFRFKAIRLTEKYLPEDIRQLYRFNIISVKYDHYKQKPIWALSCTRHFPTAPHICNGLDFSHYPAKTGRYQALTSGYKNLLIIVPRRDARYVRRLSAIWHNYPKDFKEKYENIFMVAMTDIERLGLEKDSYLQSRRLFNDLVNTLNGIEECDFDLTITNVNKILRDHPNQKYSNKESKSALEDKSMMASVMTLESHKPTSWFQNTTRTYRFLTSNFSPEETLVTDYKNIKEGTAYNFASMVRAFYSGCKIKTDEGQLKDYIMSAYGVDITKIKYIMDIRKTNLKYFKDYPYIDLVDCMTWLDQAKWQLDNKLPDNLYKGIQRAISFKRYYEEEKGVVFNSSTAKKLELIYDYVEGAIASAKLAEADRTYLIQCPYISGIHSKNTYGVFRYIQKMLRKPGYDDIGGVLDIGCNRWEHRFYMFEHLRKNQKHKDSSMIEKRMHNTLLTLLRGY